MKLSSRNHGKPYIIALGVAMTLLALVVLFVAIKNGGLDIRSKASGATCMKIRGTTCPKGYLQDAQGGSSVEGRSQYSKIMVNRITCCKVSTTEECTQTKMVEGAKFRCPSGWENRGNGKCCKLTTMRATPTSGQTTPCRRCSNNFGCKMATWTNAGADCEPVNPVEPVDYRLDCGCPAVSDAVLATYPEDTNNDACSICATMTPTSSYGIPVQTEMPQIQQSGEERGWLFHETETGGETLREQPAELEQPETSDESGITPLSAPDSLNERARAALCTFFRICSETILETSP